MSNNNLSNIDMASTDSILANLDTSLLQLKNIGIYLIIQKFTEAEASRIQRLNIYLSELEERLFDVDSIESLDYSEKLDAYKLVRDSINQSFKNVRESSRGFNSDDIEAKLATLNKSNLAGIDVNDNDKDRLSIISTALMERISKERLTKDGV